MVTEVAAAVTTKTLPLIQSFVFNFWGDGVTSVGSVTTSLTNFQSLSGWATKSPSGIAYINIANGTAYSGAVLSATATVTAAGVLTVTFNTPPIANQAVEVVVGILF